ncbi:ATP-binding protein [Streptomyces odontomachi]|uniref:ATP-binding protein n=1 Tax=Streptomyces odontomachi TaxID=2944940 RepID=UPI00210872EC|nr:ATP-binding protein [Streptomyces sp. ODS25]
MDIGRVMEVWSAGAGRAATGYLVGDRAVLTVGHAVRAAGDAATGGTATRGMDTAGTAMAGRAMAGTAAARIEVRRLGDDRWCAAEVIPLRAAPDIALIRITDPAWQPPVLAPVRWGRVPTVGQEPVPPVGQAGAVRGAAPHRLPFLAVGFPDAEQRPDRVRDSKEIRGHLETLTGLKSGLLALHVDDSAVPTPRPTPPPSPSPTAPGLRPLPAAEDRGRRAPAWASGWAGSSGAAVFCGPLLIGVLCTDRASAYRGDQLTAVPITALTADPEGATGLAAALGAPPVLEDAVPSVLVPVSAAGVFTEPAVLPDRPPPPPSFLLRSDYEVVPFQGRTDEVAALTEWCRTPDPVGLRLCHGPGGQGKTRLAQRLISRMTEHGWTAGRLRTHHDQDAFARLLGAARDVLLVVDYAEAIPNQELTGLLELAARPRQAGARVRVLLLARGPGEWWSNLLLRLPDQLAVLAPDAEYALPPLFPRPEERQAEFRRALTEFAARGGYRTEGLPPAADLSEPRYASVLTLHMTALALLLDHQAEGERSQLDERAEGERSELDHQGEGQRPEGERPPAAGPPQNAAYRDPAARVLVHERRYWADSARAAELPDTGARLLDAVMAAATCCGAAGREEALEVLALLPDLEGEHRRTRGRYADWVHDLHPGEDWLNGLQPDLLGEYFVTRTLEAQRDLVAALAREARKDQALRLVTTLARAAVHQEAAAVVLHTVFSHAGDDVFLAATVAAPYVDSPHLLVDVLLPAVPRVADDDILYTATVEHPHVGRTAPLKIAMAREALQRFRALPERLLDREAELSRALADGLRSAQDEDAGAAAAEAVRLFTELAAEDPARYTWDLIGARINQGAHVAADEALDIADTVVRQIHRAHKQDPGAAERTLTEAYMVRAMALKKLRRVKDAVHASEQAERHCRKAAAMGQKEAAARFPTVQMNLANNYSRAGMHHAALAKINEAVEELRRQYAEHPDPLRPNLPQALVNQAQCHADVGDLPRALAVIEEATDRWERIATHQEHWRETLMTTHAIWLNLLGKAPGAQASRRAFTAAVTRAAALVEQRGSAG